MPETHIPGYNPDDAAEREIFDSLVSDEKQKLEWQYWELAAQLRENPAPQKVPDGFSTHGRRTGLDVLEAMGFFDTVDAAGQRVYSDNELLTYIDEESGELSERFGELIEREARRRVEESLRADAASVESIERAAVLPTDTLDVMTLPPGRGEIRSGSGGEGRFEKKRLFPRKEMFRDLLAEMGLSYDWYPMKRKHELSDSVRAEVETSVRGSQGRTEDEVARAMYDVFVIPDLDVTIYVSDLEGEGTHVYFVDPLAEVRETDGDASVAMKDFVEEVRSKDNAGELPYVHHRIRWNDSEDIWKNELQTLLNDVEGIRKSLEEDTPPKRNEDTKVHSSLGQEQHEMAPDGWYTVHALSNELGVDAQTVVRIIVSELENHPEWKHTYRDERLTRRPHYHPELCTLVRKEVKSREKPPDGWISNRAAAKALHISQEKAIALASAYQKKHPEWLGSFYIRRNVEGRYYHPDLVEQMKRDLGERELAPDGWLNMTGLQGVLSDSVVGLKTLKKIVAKYRKEHPDWFHSYLAGKGGMTEYFHPDCVEAIMTEIDSYTPAPDGWVSVRSLRHDLNVQKSTISEIAKGLIAKHADWVGKFYSPVQADNVLHYHPDLISAIKQELNTRQSPPEGWITNRVASEVLEASFDVVKKMAYEYRRVHPEWFHHYYISGLERECFSPVLIAKMKERFDDMKEPPEGWRTVNRLSEEIGKAEAFVRKRLKKYRTSHPHWIQTYYQAKQPFEFMHPKLVNIITNEVEAVTPPPEGWVSMRAIAEELGATRTTAFQRRLKAFGNKNSSLVGVFDSRGREVTYYHPDVIEVLKKERDAREFAPKE